MLPRIERIWSVSRKLKGIGGPWSSVDPVETQCQDPSRIDFFMESMMADMFEKTYPKSTSEGKPSVAEDLIILSFMSLASGSSDSET